MAHKVFICHSSRDKQIADAACAALEAQRIPCWIAPRDVIAGDEWGKSIIDALAGCHVVVLIFSEHANESPQVRCEIERAVGKGKIIVPFRIENVLPSDAMEYALSNTHWLDAITPPMEGRLADLTQTILRLMERVPRSESLPPETLIPPIATPATPVSAVKAGGRRMMHPWIAAAVLLVAGGATAATVAYLHRTSTEPTPKPLQTRLVQPPNPDPVIPPEPPQGNKPPLHKVSPQPGPEKVIIVLPESRPANSLPAPPVQPQLTPQQQDALDQVEMKLDQMSSRAVSINTSLETMQASMQRDGMTMRGDVVTHRASMNNSLTKARQALVAHDPDRAGRFADQAQLDITALLTFLGR